MLTTNYRNNITLWGSPDEPIHSQYGHGTYREWCLCEVARIARSGGRAELVTHDDGQMICVQREDCPKPLWS